MRYSAFISYNHRDRAIAGWVHRRLETYRVPKGLRGRDGPLGTIGARLPPVFQDREELASSPDLAHSVRAALENAASLVVICSPDAVRSRWVNEEIRIFRALGRASRIQCLIVRGQPYVSRLPGSDPDDECFPPALFEDGAAEPLAADCRVNGDGKRAAVLKLIAGILGVGYAELRDREAHRSHRRLALTAAASLVGFVLMSAVALFALEQRRQAVTERDIARQKTMTAERTIDFVESLFEVSDPSDARGASITAREVLDRGARRIDSSLADEPTVKAELMATLSEVYGSLGLLRQSDAMVRKTFAVAGRDPSLAARQLMLLGESQLHQAHYRSASQALLRALFLARQPSNRHADLVPRILVDMSEALARDNQAAAAKRAGADALTASRVLGTSAAIRASALEAVAKASFLDGDHDRAEPYYRAAVTLRSASQGALHPRVTDDLTTLGDIAYLRHRPDVAERYYRQVLANDRLVLGPHHPDTAQTLNSLGRVLLEQRKLQAARAMLIQAIAINRRELDDTSDAFVFVFDNLGLVEWALGQPAMAEPLFRKGLAAAVAHRHRNRAPIMTDLANALCAQGKYAEAWPLLDHARPLMVSTYPDDPWRVAWVDSAKGACLVDAERTTEGEALIAASSAPLQKRWSPTSYYGQIAAERLRAIR